MPTNYNAPDPHITILGEMPPPKDSVALELAEQFIRENPLLGLNEKQCIYHLKRIPADKWIIISIFLSTTCPNDMDYSTIRALSSMPENTLTWVIDFVTRHNTRSSEAVFVLSNLNMEELDSFTQLLEAHDLLQKPKIWRAIFAMPAEYQENFIHFCKERQYDTEGLNGGLIFQQHPPKDWLEIDNFLKQIRVSNLVLDTLAQMPATACLHYMRFISTNKIDDWETKSTLEKIAQSLRQVIWDFVCKHKLSISAFKNIPENRWPSVSAFIERHVQAPNTTLSKDTIDALIQISDENWTEFNDFLDEHQIHDFELITEYAKMPALQRNYLFDFIQKYELKSFEISAFRLISDDDWSSFIALIEKNQLTNKYQLHALACRPTEEWTAYAALIVRRKIHDAYTLMKLETISSQHFHFLCAFVDEYAIDDVQVIYGLAQIPSIRQWKNIYDLAQPLFAPPLRAEMRGCLMHDLYKITIKQYRFDRSVPTYNNTERLARIAVVQRNIEQGLMPENPEQYYTKMCAILEQPTRQPGTEESNATAIHVHADDREEGTGHALQQLIALPYEKNQIDTDYGAFLTYLNAFPNTFIKASAHCVLGLASSQTEGFAPLYADTVITSYDLNITGKELLARCWNFIQHGEFIGIDDAEALAKDRENARISLIRHLADAYEDDAVVCNPGKLQHIAVGILQGRLEGAHIDRAIPISLQSAPDEMLTDKAMSSSLVKNTVAASLHDFLLQYEAAVTCQAELKSQVNGWLEALRGLDTDAHQQYCENFRKELDDYLKLSDLPEEQVVEIANDYIEIPTSLPYLEENLGKDVEIENEQTELPLVNIQSVKNNYTRLLNTLAQHVESVCLSKWTSGGARSPKVRILRALATFVTQQEESWIIDAVNKTRLLTLIKSICNTHRNWTPMHFEPPTSFGEFLILVKNAPNEYGTSDNSINLLKTAVLASHQLEAISTEDFNALLEGMPIEQSNVCRT